MKILAIPSLPEYLLLDDDLHMLQFYEQPRTMWGESLQELIDECKILHTQFTGAVGRNRYSQEPGSFIIDVPTFDDLFALPQTHPELFL